MPENLNSPHAKQEERKYAKGYCRFLGKSNSGQCMGLAREWYDGEEDLVNNNQGEASEAQ